MKELSSIGITVLQIFAPAFAGVAALLARQLHALIQAKVHNERLSGILTRLSDTAWTVVTEIQQTMVSKLDPEKPLESLLAAQRAALCSLKTHLGQKGLDEIKFILGLDDEGLEKVLCSHIEAKVHAMKQCLAVGGAR